MRQALLVGPDGAWRHDLWLDGLVEPPPTGAAADAAAKDMAGSSPSVAADVAPPAAAAADLPGPGRPGHEAGAGGSAPGPAAARPATRARGAAAAKVAPPILDPNTATLDSLQLLPGVGPVLAGRIAAAREGGTIFRQPSDLLAVKGIGPASLARLAPFLRFPGAGRPAAAPAADADNRH